MNRLAIVVLNWNGIDETLPCIDSLLNQTYKDFQIIVVENGSTDNSKELLKKKQKEVGGKKLHIIFSKINTGFAGGVNIGINYALARDFEGIALFNNDAIADKNWLKELAHSMSLQPHTGIVTSLLLHTDGKTIDSTGDWYSTWGLSFPRSRNALKRNAPKAGYVFSGSGGASLYRAKMLEDIGNFDDKFFAYYEDVDISFRAQLAGWEVYYNPKAIAYHEQGVTSDKISGFTTYQTFKNWPMLFIKDVPGELLFKIGIRFWLAYTLLFFNTIRNKTFWPALRGWVAGVWLVFSHAIPRRIEIQKSKVVETKYIEKMLWGGIPPDQSGLLKFQQFFTRRKK